MTRPRPIPIERVRRVALAAQGFATRRPTGRVDRRHLRRVLDRIGIVQIDSVNVIARSQDLVLFARLGPHPTDLLPAAADAGELFEYWVHEASHVPTAHHHLHRWRMTDVHAWRGVREFAARRPDVIDEVHRHVVEHGPVVAGDVSRRTTPKGTWWDWDEGKIALEHLFQAGVVSARRRRRDFARVYDLTERMIPGDVLERPAAPERDARKELLVLAARSYGIATDDDLADYHRQKVTVCRPLLSELVDEGRLEQVLVDGWNRPTYRHPEAAAPRSVSARALLSPFDPVVWHRARAERLFGFRYRIEIYVPAAKRIHGYYVLPFLLGDRLVGRVDLKTDRAAGCLVVRSAWHEAACGVEPVHVARELLAELEEMAGWLGVERVVVEERGDLSPQLRALVGLDRRVSSPT